jgi:hypothetical protein
VQKLARKLEPAGVALATGKTKSAGHAGTTASRPAPGLPSPEENG